MKYLDRVRVLTGDYEKYNIKKGDVGTIIMSEMRKNTFEVVFSLPNGQDYAEWNININDLELVKSSDITDEDILEDLPKNDPNWWCKVEDGYILNLKCEKKNKIPYNYNS
jgi:hypothetical protein